MSFITLKEVELLCLFLSPGRSKMIFNGEEIGKRDEGRKKGERRKEDEKKGGTWESRRKKSFGDAKRMVCDLFSLTNSK